jgi:hypothetical protein
MRKLINEKWKVLPSPMMECIFKDIDNPRRDYKKLAKVNNDLEHNYLALKQVVFVNCNSRLKPLF